MRTAVATAMGWTPYMARPYGPWHDDDHDDLDDDDDDDDHLAGPCCQPYGPAMWAMA